MKDGLQVYQIARFTRHQTKLPTQMKVHMLTLITISTHHLYSTLLIMEIGLMDSWMNQTWEELIVSTTILQAIPEETLVQGGMIQILKVAAFMMMTILLQVNSVASAKNLRLRASKTVLMMTVSLIKQEIHVRDGMMITQLDAVVGIQKLSQPLSLAALVVAEFRVNLTNQIQPHKIALMI